MGIEVLLTVHDKRWKKSLADFLAGIAEQTLRAMKIKHKDVQIGLLLTDAKEMHQLNKTYRGKDKSTNVLSFADLDEGFPGTFLLGDVVLSYDDTYQESLDLPKTFQEHAAHLVIHGVLHLLGYDHQTDAEAEVMEGKECVLLQKFLGPLTKSKTALKKA